MDDKDNYKDCMEEHVENDEKVSMKEYAKNEKLFNAHASSLSRILGLGTNFGHEHRIKEAVVVLNSHPPDLYGLRKDHKEEKVEKVFEEGRNEIEVTNNPANCLKNKNKDEVGGKIGTWKHSG